MKSVVSRLAVAVFLAAFLLPRTAAPQSRKKPVRPERVLPDRTLALLSISDWTRTKERFEETALHDIWQENAIKEFVTPITTKMDAVLDRARAECREGLGMELDALSVVFQGAIHVGVVGIRVRKKSAAANAEDNPNVVRMLRRIVTQERVFKAQVEVDQDGDGVGEYGLLGELAGEIARRPKKKERVVPPYLGTAFSTGGSGGKGYASADGYHYRVLLPAGPTNAGDDRVLGGTAVRGGPPAPAAAIDEQEGHFLVYAWPIKREEADRVYVANEEGRVYSAAMQAGGYSGQAKPKPDAASVPGAPLFRGKIGGRGNDGNYWRATGRSDKGPSGLDTSAEVALLLTPHDLRAAKAVLERLEGTVKLADTKIKTEKLKVDGVEVTKMWYEGETVRDASYHAWLGPTFVLTMGAPKDTIETIVTNWRRKGADALGATDSFAAVSKNAEFNRADVSLYISAAKILEKVQEQVEEARQPMIKALGLPGLTAAGASLRFDGRGIKDILYLHAPGPRQGVLRLLSPKPLDRRLIEVVPPKAAFCIVSRFNPRVLWEEIEKLMEAMGPEAEIKFRDGVATFQEDYGLDVPGELIPAFGDTLVVFRAPPLQGEVGFGMLDWTLILGVKNRAKAEVTLEKLRRLLAQIAASAAKRPRPDRPQPGPAQPPEWQETPYKEETIHSLMARGFPLGRLSYALVKDQLVVGIHPLRVQRAIDRLGAKDTGIKRDPDFKKALEKVGSGYGSLWYIDMRRALKHIQGLLAGAMLAAGPDMPFDLSKLAAASAIEQHLFGHLTICKSDASGIRFIGYSPTGSVGAWAVVAGGALGAMALPEVMGPR
ncbi:MAG: hypothetical protein GXP25_16755 [Planctomycetes bacterium]|nr:hypothetical protein [Planctomycetota bacterium]